MPSEVPEVVTVWGHTGPPPSNELGVILWSSFGDGQALSLPTMVHSRREYWKAEYAAWLRSVGNSYSRTPAARRFASRHDGLSYWWMTLPTEFTFTQGSLVYEVMRVMALVDFLNEDPPAKLRFEGLPDHVVECLWQWCRAKQISAESGSRTIPLRSKSPMPSTSAVAGLKHIAASYVRYRGSQGRKHRPRITVIDYFDNLMPASLDGSAYSSKYWGGLIEEIEASGADVEWVHIDVRSSELPTAALAASTSRHLDSKSGVSHGLAQEGMTFQLAVRCLATFRAIQRLGQDAWREVDFSDHSRGIDFRSIVARSWSSHHSGLGAAVNALWIHYMRVVARSANGPCLYLLENQPWEMALLHYWRLYQRHAISGFAHAVIRGWDIRYALPLAGPISEHSESAPQPDRLLVGSHDEAVLACENGYPLQAITEVEALRFITSWRTDTVPGSESGNGRVLLLGEIDEASSLELFKISARLKTSGWQVAFRPHPSQQGVTSEIPEWMSVSVTPTIEEALSSCDAVIAMSTSTAVIAAARAQVPIVLVRDGRILDGCLIDSSLVALQLSVDSTVNPSELDAIRAGHSHGDLMHGQHLDPSLPRWRSWLRQVS